MDICDWRYASRERCAAPRGRSRVAGISRGACRRKARREEDRVERRRRRRRELHHRYRRDLRRTCRARSVAQRRAGPLFADEFSPGEAVPVLRRDAGSRGSRRHDRPRRRFRRRRQGCALATHLGPGRSHAARHRNGGARRARSAVADSSRGHERRGVRSREAQRYDRHRRLQEGCVHAGPAGGWRRQCRAARAHHRTHGHQRRRGKRRRRLELSRAQGPVRERRRGFRGPGSPAAGETQDRRCAHCGGQVHQRAGRQGRHRCGRQDRQSWPPSCQRRTRHQSAFGRLARRRERARPRAAASLFRGADQRHRDEWRCRRPRSTGLCDGCGVRSPRQLCRRRCDIRFRIARPSGLAGVAALEDVDPDRCRRCVRTPQSCAGRHRPR